MKQMCNGLLVVCATAAIVAPALAGSPQFINARTRPAPLAQGSRGAPPAQFTMFDAPGAGTAAGQGTFAFVVNSSAMVAGAYADSSNNTHGFLRAADGTFTTIDVDGPSSQTEAVWLNNHGAAAGTYVDQNTGILQGFLRMSGGRIETFDGAGGGSRQTDTSAERRDTCASSPLVIRS